jgi:hypothetical protein
LLQSNVDRAIINAEVAKAFGKQNNIPVLRWKCKLSLDLPLSVEAILLAGGPRCQNTTKYTTRQNIMENELI